MKSGLAGDRAALSYPAIPPVKTQLCHFTEMRPVCCVMGAPEEAEPRTVRLCVGQKEGLGLHVPCC